MKVTPVSSSFAAVVVTVGVVAVVALFSFDGGMGRTGGSGENLPIGGVAHFTVYDAKGAVVGSWMGHNSLTPQAIGQIALCLSGVANPFPPAQPYYISSCGGAYGSGLTQAIVLGWVPTGAASGCPYTPLYNGQGAVVGTQAGLSCATEPTSVAFYPITCSYPSYSSSDGCAGWTATATFPSSDFSSNGCGPSCTITEALALTGTSWGGGGFSTVHSTVNGLTLTTVLPNYGNAFDYLTPSVSLSQGDSLQVTIQFTIT